MEFSINHPVLFLVAGLLIAVVLGQSIFFLVKALRRSKANAVKADPSGTHRREIYRKPISGNHFPRKSGRNAQTADARLSVAPHGCNSERCAAFRPQL